MTETKKEIGPKSEAFLRERGLDSRELRALYR
jgi:hypothetical protein